MLEPLTTPETQEISRPVPPALWGRDHFSTLLYVETLVVDHDGLFDKVRGQYAARMRGRDSGLPSQIRDGELPQHDDFDCLEDMRAAGVLEGCERNTFAAFNAGEGPDPNQQPHTPIILTGAGWRLAHLLRRWRGSGCEGLPPVELVLGAIAGRDGSIEVRVHRAQGIGEERVPSVALVIADDLPDLPPGLPENGQMGWARQAMAQYRGDAERIMTAVGALPGGTQDQLLVLLLERKASLFRVPFINFLPPAEGEIREETPCTT